MIKYLVHANHATNLLHPSMPTQVRWVHNPTIVNTSIRYQYQYRYRYQYQHTFQYHHTKSCMVLGRQQRKRAEYLVIIMEKERQRATGNTYNDFGVTILVMTTQSRRRNLDGTGKVGAEGVNQLVWTTTIQRWGY